jgi:hypothetical protein
VLLASGIPMSVVTARARSSVREAYSVAIAPSRWTRSCTLEVDQVPNPSRASATARSTSACVPSSTVPLGSPVEGLVRVDVVMSAVFDQAPSM